MTSSEIGVAGAVLLVVLLVGVVAGRARRRWALLLAGLVAVIVLGVVTTSLTSAPDQGLGDTRAGGIARLYTTAVPLVVVFVAGWLCARGTWFRRLIVLAAAALLLAAFPYAAAGQATANLIPGNLIPASDGP